MIDAPHGHGHKIPANETLKASMPNLTADAPPLALLARGVTKVFGAGEARVEALRGVDLSVARGEFVAIMGPSGSGKSTLLNVLAGIETPDAGEVMVAGADLARMSDEERTIARRRSLGFIFQKIHLLPSLTAIENVTLPLLLDGVERIAARERAMTALGSVAMSHRRGHLPQTLSGGEQQRVAIARALVIRPQLLLADEPTGALDSDNGRQVVSLLRRLVDDEGQTLVLVTHDAGVAAAADRVVHVRNGQIEVDAAAAASGSARR